MAQNGQQQVSNLRDAGTANAIHTEPCSEPSSPTDVPYSVFKPWEKKVIVLSASVGAIFSPMSTTIYLPALNQLAKDLNVSASEINLTVTTFLVSRHTLHDHPESQQTVQILQGLAPAVTAGFSDSAGRRPAYVICFTLYIAANIGLCLQSNYAALMVLRCIQSAGSSGTVALAQGVVADVVTSAERGTYVGLTSVPTIVGPVVGPILGGVLAEYGGWRWIFYFLIILSGAFFLPFLLFFPETCRKVVGNGSVPPPLLNSSLTSIIKERQRVRNGFGIDLAQREEVMRNYRLSIPNPLSTLVIIKDKESALILFCSGFLVACLYAVNTGLPSQFSKIYHFNEIKIGLAFIPFGSGGLVSAFTTGRLIDRSWHRHASRAGFPVVKNRYQDLTEFPVEKARLGVAVPLLLLSCFAMIAYGWVLDFQTSLAGPLVVLFFIGYGIMAGFQIMQILMVDLNPGDPAASTAANNLFRCLLGAGSTAVVVPMIDKMTVGWTYTFAALLWLSFSPTLWLLTKYGPRWRKAKKDKEMARPRNGDAALGTGRAPDMAAANGEARLEKGLGQYKQLELENRQMAVVRSKEEQAGR